MAPAYPYSIYSFGDWERLINTTVDPFAEMEFNTSTTTTTPIPSSTFVPSNFFIPSSSSSSTRIQNTTIDQNDTFGPTLPTMVHSQIPDFGVQNNRFEWAAGGFASIVFSMIIWLLSRWMKRRANSGTFKVEPVVEQSVRLIELDEITAAIPHPPIPPPLPTTFTALDPPIFKAKAEECARDTLMRQIREAYTLRQRNHSARCENTV